MSAIGGQRILSNFGQMNDTLTAFCTRRYRDGTRVVMRSISKPPLAKRFWMSRAVLELLQIADEVIE